MNSNAASTRLHVQAERLKKTGRMGGVVQLAHALLRVSDPVWSCEACQSMLPEYITAEMNGCLPDSNTLEHLSGCPDCHAVYLDLIQVATLAEQGILPTPDLPIDLSFLPSTSEEIS